MLAVRIASCMMWALLATTTQGQWRPQFLALRAQRRM